jgi:hypothetical protein
MNPKEQALMHILRVVAEQDVPSRSVDLWKRVHDRASADLSQRAVRARYRLVVLAILGISLVAATPPAQALVRTLWHELGLVFTSEETQANDERAMRVILEPTVIPDRPSPLGIEEIQAQVPFHVRVPEWLPEGLQLHVGTVSITDAGTQARLSFRAPTATSERDPARLDLVIGPVAPYLVPSSREQAVEINGVRAIYVHGGWAAGDSPDTQLVWDDAEDDAFLTWEEDDLPYLLFAHGLGLELPDMLRIAESLN